MTAADVISACALDAVIGDPRRFPHPVRMMGSASVWFEQVIRPSCRRPPALRIAGTVLALGLPAVAAIGGWAVIAVATGIHEWIGFVVNLWLASTVLAWRDLMDHSNRVLDALRQTDLVEARKAVSLIVGRDTDQLSEQEIVRATVETVAESASDGVVAPLFYLTLGGVPLALAFKAVSTLDSLVGHQDDQYREFGWASARLDDLLNWIPSRLTGWLMVAAGAIVMRDLQAATRGATVLLRDGHKHASPNSGRPEAAMAGAIGVQLGGESYYDGKRVVRPYLGEPVHALSPNHIEQAQRIMSVSYVLGIAGSIVCLAL